MISPFYTSSQKGILISAVGAVPEESRIRFPLMPVRSRAHRSAVMTTNEDESLRTAVWKGRHADEFGSPGGEPVHLDDCCNGPVLKNPVRRINKCNRDFRAVVMSAPSVSGLGSASLRTYNESAMFAFRGKEQLNQVERCPEVGFEGV